MIYIISINLITGIIILILGHKIGEKGGQRIINRIFIINSIIIIYYINKIIIKGEERRIYINNWFNDILKDIEINIIIDKITIIMTTIIILISYIIMKYSNWYIKELKFKGYIYIFLVSMIILVSTKEYISIYIGWEWVGITSYLLINYWYNNTNNNKAAIKAIVYNKIGDITILLLIAHILYMNNSTTYSILSYNNTYDLFPYLIPIYIGISSMAKSAQYMFHPWLGDAMAGPTPVSALLHAATMVTAGIILLYRSIEYNSPIWDYIMYFGIITIIFGGMVSMTQNDIKKIIAYSTCSQLGYMYFIAIYNNVSIDYSFFHLFIHAFFKALLFLTAGIIIHYASSEQDIRRIQLSPKSLPYHLLLFSSLSLISFPYTSGYYSKESILYTITETHMVLYIAILGAILTSLYSYKLLYKIICGVIPIRTTSSFPSSIYLFLLPLLLGSIFLGSYYITHFLATSSFSIYTISYCSILPILSFVLYYLSTHIIISSYSLSSLLYIPYLIFNKRTFVDSIVNSISFSSITYIYSILINLDKGLLEYIGPLGLYKLFLNNNLYLLSSYSKLNIILSFFLSLVLSICLLFIY